MPPYSAKKSAGVRIQSLERGLRILDLVGRSSGGVALGELARLMGLGKTTVHNLARTLVSTGHLVQRRDPIRYALGPALFALAGRQRLDSLHERAAPVLLELSEEFAGCAALLVEPAGPEVRVRLRVSGEQPGVVQRPLDRFSPPYSNATSLLFLALWGEEERRAFEARHPFWEHGAHLWRDEQALEEQLQKIQAQGYAALDQALGKAFPVAAPLYSENGELLAGLGLAYRSEKKITAATKKNLVAQVLAAAGRLTGAAASPPACAAGRPTATCPSTAGTSG